MFIQEEEETNGEKEVSRKEKESVFSKDPAWSCDIVHPESVPAEVRCEADQRTCKLGGPPTWNPLFYKRINGCAEGKETSAVEYSHFILTGQHWPMQVLQYFWNILSFPEEGEEGTAKLL